jgi:hypothetical protein
LEYKCQKCDGIHLLQDIYGYDIMGQMGMTHLKPVSTCPLFENLSIEKDNLSGAKDATNYRNIVGAL